MKNLSIPASLRRFSSLIESVEDDRKNQNGWWVYLKNGYICTSSETHQIHEDTLSVCASILTSEIAPCQCSDCLAVSR